MTKRQKLIQQIKAHYRNNDLKSAMRVYIENRCISFNTYQKALYETNKYKHS